MEPEIRKAFGTKEGQVAALFESLQAKIEDYGVQIKEIIENQKDKEIKDIIKAKD